MSEFNNLVMPLSPSVWAALVFSLILVTLLLAIFYVTYQASETLSTSVLKHGLTPTDFIIYPIALMIEPVSRPWFRTGSAGDSKTFDGIHLNFVEHFIHRKPPLHYLGGCDCFLGTILHV